MRIVIEDDPSTLEERGEAVSVKEYDPNSTNWSDETTKKDWSKGVLKVKEWSEVDQIEVVSSE